jgi:NAD(P)-dependent dehydrogenase (short-subunit alcohol dehydrogenase family)
VNLPVCNPMDLSTKTILVTGASSGIGRATALLASQLGAAVVLVGRSLDTLAETQNALAGTGHRVMAADLSQPTQIDGLIRRIEDENRPLDGLFHAAGLESVAVLPLIKDAQIQEALAVHLQAGVLLAKGFSRKKCRTAARGSLVFMSSVAGTRGQAGMVLYCAAKAALDGATRALAVELASKNIRVNSLASGGVETPMHGRLQKCMSPDASSRYLQQHLLGFGTPVEVANAACFLLSDASSWMTGTTLVIDGGYSCH